MFCKYNLNCQVSTLKTYVKHCKLKNDRPLNWICALNKLHLLLRKVDRIFSVILFHPRLLLTLVMVIEGNTHRKAQ